ncbi:MAG: hypothetical protein G8345_14955 [Magnetococcales bacterium]|nr:hypothetical protein [Magnetococcales bacterium]NGZ28177.1 hypothetical protein [Magnetococcales bacterium]
MSDTPELLLMLGRIQGTLEAVQHRQEHHTTLLVNLDDRLRLVERRAAVHGTVGGTAAALAMTAFTQMIKAKLEWL